MRAISERVALDTLTESVKTPDDFIKKYYYAELTASYLRDLQRLERNISRTMSSVYQENLGKINGALRMSSSARKSKLVSVFESMLGEVLEYFITKRSNIYQTVQEKSRIVINTLINMAT